MPPRLSQSAEAARAAALQAEFNEKKWVWVPDEKDGYVAGWVLKEEANEGDIVLASGGEVRIFVPFLNLILLKGRSRFEGSHLDCYRR